MGKEVRGRFEEFCAECANGRTLSQEEFTSVFQDQSVLEGPLPDHFMKQTLFDPTTYNENISRPSRELGFEEYLVWSKNTAFMAERYWIDQEDAHVREVCHELAAPLLTIERAREAFNKAD